MSTWASLMVIAGGLFAGGAASFGWSRVPIWGGWGLEELIGDFEQTLRRTDQVQPALVIVAIVSGGGFALSAEGSARRWGLRCRCSGAWWRAGLRRRKRSRGAVRAGLGGTSAARCLRWRRLWRLPWQRPSDSQVDETRGT
jgi:hypothetical protein